MKIKLMLIVLSLVLCTTGCSQDENDKNDNNVSKEPAHTSGANKLPSGEGDVSETTSAPTIESTDSPKVTVSPNVETNAPKETMSPSVETVAPDETTATPDGQTGTSQLDDDEMSKEDEYEYVCGYVFEEETNLTRQNRCVSQLKERIKLLALSDTEVWVANNKLYIGYNNKEYKELIDLLTKKGEIQFRYKEDFLVFDDDKIKSVEIKQGYNENDVLIFKLVEDYESKFYNFTNEHIGGWFVLSCDGTDIMRITIDMPVESGEFSVIKVPEKKVLDLFPVYIQSGTIIELNPTAV